MHSHFVGFVMRWLSYENSRFRAHPRTPRQLEVKQHSISFGSDFGFPYMFYAFRPFFPKLPIRLSPMSFSKNIKTTTKVFEKCQIKELA